MRGQIAIEFMVNFLVFLLVVSIFAGSLIVFKEKAEMENERIDTMLKIEGIARAIDCKVFMGPHSYANVSELNVKAEKNRVMVDYLGKVIVVESIYSRGENSEPI